MAVVGLRLASLPVLENGRRGAETEAGPGAGWDSDWGNPGGEKPARGTRSSAIKRRQHVNHGAKVQVSRCWIVYGCVPTFTKLSASVCSLN